MWWKYRIDVTREGPPLEGERHRWPQRETGDPPLRDVCAARRTWLKLAARRLNNSFFSQEVSTRSKQYYQYYFCFAFVLDFSKLAHKGGGKCEEKQRGRKVLRIQHFWTKPFFNIYFIPLFFAFSI